MGTLAKSFLLNDLQSYIEKSYYNLSFGISVRLSKSAES